MKSKNKSSSKAVTHKNKDIHLDDTSNLLPPSNHKPSLPSSLTSWEQAFQSAAQVGIASVPSHSDEIGTTETDHATAQLSADTTSIRAGMHKDGVQQYGAGNLTKVSEIARLFPPRQSSSLLLSSNNSLSVGTQEPIIAVTQDEDPYFLKTKNTKNNGGTCSSKSSSDSIVSKRHKRSDPPDKDDDPDARKSNHDSSSRDSHKKIKYSTNNHANEKQKHHNDSVAKELSDDIQKVKKSTKKQSKAEKKGKERREKKHKHDIVSKGSPTTSQKEKQGDSKRQDSGRKRERVEVDEENKDHDTSVSCESIPMEGQIVSHNGENLFVLIDKKNGIVYSMERHSETGKHVAIGTYEKGGKVVIESVYDTMRESRDFPFAVDPDDHCESPLNSYKDICPILEYLSQSIQTPLAIYDPYYCNGLVKENLLKLGYSNVYNRKEDAYKTWDESDASQPYPNYDILVTNPPYSGDHPERLIRHLTEDPRTKGKPWCLLMPQYIHKKDYYKKILATKSQDGIMPFYLVPKKRYVYVPPKDFREKKESDVHKKSSPFVSMWYIWGGTSKITDELIRIYQQQGKEQNCELARSTSALRDLRRKHKKK